MAVKKATDITRAATFFEPKFEVMINRVVESYKLLEHAHDFLEICYVSEGSGFHYIEGQTIPVVKGDWFFVPIGATHVFRPATPASLRHGHLIVYNCIFTPEYARQLASAFPLTPALQALLFAEYPTQSWLHMRDPDDAIQETLNRLLEEYSQRNMGFESLLQADIMRLLVAMLRQQLPAPTPGVPVRAGMAHVMELIHARFAEPLQIAELASEAGLGERQFRRQFTRFAGMRFSDYIQKLRIERCCYLLQHTSDPVSLIAQTVGYQDIKFFNQLFKKKTGMTPREYRGR